MAGPVVKRRIVGMTRNYDGVPLHKNIGRTSQPPKQPLDDAELDNSKTRKPSPDILAAPLSSSDEEDASPKRKFTEMEQQDSSQRKRKKQAISGKMNQGMSPATKRSPRLSRTVNDTSVGIAEEEVIDRREEEIFSSSQQSRKGPVTYGRSVPKLERKKPVKETPTPRRKEKDGFKSPATNSATTSGHKLDEEDTFRMPRMDLLEPSIKDQAKEFKMRDPLSLSRPDLIAPDKGFQDKVFKVSDPRLRSDIQQALNATNRGYISRPDPLDFLTDPVSSSETLPGGEIFSPKRKRATSSSSLSSLSSANISSSTEPCPLCEVPVSREFFESYNSGRPLKYSDQHKFCHDHRLNTAHSQWKEKGYPSIDWTNWAASRITKQHTSTLLNILYGKRVSYYASMLSEHASRGLKSLQDFFKEGIVDVVSAGYYGPKGSKLMAQYIQDRLARQLNLSARKNELVRDAGVGGYVQAVLVPELTVLLVKEDLNLGGVGDDVDDKADQAARDVLNDSLDMGILINGEEEDTIPFEKDDYEDDENF